MAANGPDGRLVPVEAAKNRVTLLRKVAGVVLLLLVAPAAFVEIRSTLGYNGAVERLCERLPSADESPLYPPEAEDLIGKSPDGAAEKEGRLDRVTYTWHGLIRRHRLMAYFTRSEKPALVRIRYVP